MLWLWELEEILGMEAQGEPQGSSTIFKVWREPDFLVAKDFKI